MTPYDPAVMYQARERTMSVQDLLRVPVDDRQYELVNGWLISEPSPAPAHGSTEARLLYFLADFLRSSNLGRVYTNVGFVLARNPDTVRAPDVAFVSRARLDRPESIGPGHPFFSGAPDLAVEILSPGERPGEVHAKVADYLAAGALLVWVVSLTRRNVLVYRELLSPRTVGESGELHGEDVLPGFRLQVAELFGEDW